MEEILVVGIIILAIILYNTKNENYELKIKYNEQLNKKVNFCPHCGERISKEDNKIINNYSHENISNNNEINNIKNNVNNGIKKDSKEVKNSALLIIGSLFIVLAAIVFLTSSWYVIGDIFKCSIIFIMLFIFIGFSHIAKNKYNLIHTSKAFKYIALSYLPLSLISPSLFNLFNGMISLPNIGGHIYLFLIGIFCSIIYYLEAKNNNKNIAYISILAQLLSILSLTTTIINSMTIVLIFMFIYSFILAILYTKNITLIDKNIHKISIFSLFVVFTILGGFNILYGLIMNEYLSSILLLLTSTITGVYILVKILEKTNISYFYTTMIIILSFYIGLYLDINISVTETIIIIGLLSSYIIDCFVNNKISTYSFIASIVTLIILYTIGIFAAIPYYYISLIILFFISIINIERQTKTNKILLVLSIFLVGFSFVFNNWLNPYIILLLSSVLCLYSFIKDTDDYKNIIHISSIIFLIVNLFIDFNLITIISNIIYLAVMALIIYKKNYQYIYYEYLGISSLLLGILKIYNSGLLSISLSTTIIVLISLLINKKDSKDQMFIMTFYVIGTLILIDNTSNFSPIINIISSLSVSYYIHKNKLNTNKYLIPILGVIPSLFMNNIFDNTILMLLSTITIMIFTILFSTDNKYNILKISPYLYLLFQSTFDLTFYYYGIMLIFITSIYYINSNNNKSLLTLLMLSFLPLYYYLLNDLNLNYSILTIGIINLYIIYIGEFILKDNNIDNKIITSVGIVLTNIYALTNYSNELDGAIYIVLIVLLVIFTYVKELNTLFKILLGTIIINILLLTRNFWYNLPWWIYILIIGIVFVTLAISNEKKNK